jgi:hypothetical protein
MTRREPTTQYFVQTTILKMVMLSKQKITANTNSKFCCLEFTAETRVFNLQEEALKFAKKNKKSRFKAFRSYDDALAFATAPFAVAITSPSMNSPGFVDGVSRFKGPKSQDLVQLRKEIENGNINMVNKHN